MFVLETFVGVVCAFFIFYVGMLVGRYLEQDAHKETPVRTEVPSKPNWSR